MNYPLFPYYYYSYGPRPFSGHTLKYQEAYFLELMQYIRAAFQNIGKTPPPFWRYELTKDNQELWKLNRMGPLGDLTPGLVGGEPAKLARTENGVEVMDLVWTSKDLYGVPDLTEEHNHSVRKINTTEFEYVLPDDETDYHSIAGLGKTIGGNYVIDMYNYIVSLLVLYGVDWTWWVEEYKELGSVFAYNHFTDPGKSLRGDELGVNKYNLTTDHIELLRITPRSIVNIADTNYNCFQMDARVTDIDALGNVSASGGSTAAMHADIEADGAMVPAFNVKAYLEISSDEYVILRGTAEQGIGTTIPNIEYGIWVGDVFTYKSIPLAVEPVDCCVVSSDFYDDKVLILNGDSTISSLLLDGSSGVSQHVVNQYAHTMAKGDNKSYYECPGYKPVAFGTPSGIDVLRENGDPEGYFDQIATDNDFSHSIDRYIMVSDASTGMICIIAELGSSGVAERNGNFVLVGTVPSIAGIQGLTRETSTCTPKEGPPCVFRMFHAVNDKNQLFTINVIPDLIGQMDVVIDSGGCYAYPRGVLTINTDGHAVSMAPYPESVKFILQTPPEVQYSGWNCIRTAISHTTTNTIIHVLIAAGEASEATASVETTANVLKHICYTIPTYSDLSNDLSYVYDDGYHTWTISGYSTQQDITIPTTTTFTYNNNSGDVGDVVHNFEYKKLKCAGSVIETGTLSFVLAAQYEETDGIDYVVNIYKDNTQYMQVIRADEPEYAITASGIIIRVGGSGYYFIPNGTTITQQVLDRDNHSTARLLAAGLTNIHPIGSGLMLAWQSLIHQFQIVGLVASSDTDYAYEIAGKWMLPIYGSPSETSSGFGFISDDEGVAYGSVLR